MAGFITKKIGSRSRSLGSILKTARTKAGISLEQAEIETKIRLKYLQTLEEGQYQHLPSEAYNVGFIRGYCRFLRLKPDRLIDLYKEERSKKRINTGPFSQSGQFAPKRVSDWQFLITPKVIGAMAAIVLFGSIIGYVGNQLKKFAQPPVLEISNVPSEFTTSKDSIELKGRTTEGSIVMMNSEPIAVSPQGEFAQNVQLSPGVNEVVVLSRSRAGKEARKTVKVLYSQDLAKLSESGKTN